MNIKQKLFIIVCAMCMFSSLSAQTVVQETRHVQPNKRLRAWEFGLGGSLVNWNRVSITGFEVSPEQYSYKLQVDHILGGGNIYIARELNRWFYLDLQGTIGATKNRIDPTGKKLSMFYMGSLGMQLRLSPIFNAKYVEPYLRVGVNYVYKNFHSLNSGVFEEDPTGHAKWEAFDTWNPTGSTDNGNSFFPLSFGAGVNAWLNNSLGLGLQGEYLMPMKKEQPRFAHLSLRVMYRLGGHDKRPEAVTVYQTIEKPVEKIIEKIVEKKVIVPAEPQICDMFDNINFEFDSYMLTAESEKILDRAASILKQYEGQFFLITGFTDAKGSDTYNMKLSKKRAKAVVQALEKRGVPGNMLKSRGVGKRAVSVTANEADDVRVGDRKVTIERVNKSQYWNRLPKSN